MKRKELVREIEAWAVSSFGTEDGTIGIRIQEPMPASLFHVILKSRITSPGIFFAN